MIKPVRQFTTIKFRSVFVLYLLILIAVNANAQQYYVNKNGNDHNKGTRQSPFKTLQKLNSTKLLPGAKVYLKGGAVFTGTLVIGQNEGGSKKRPILITSYGKGMATINGQFKQAIIINGSYVTLRRLKAVGWGRKDGNTTDGILLSGCNGALVQNVVTERFQKSGLCAYNCTNTRILKVTAKHNGEVGIMLSGTRDQSKNILIKDCLAENNPGDPTNFTNHSGNGILVGGSSNVLVDHCVATNNGWDMPRIGNGPVGIWGYESDHLIIQYCISYNNKTHEGASDGGGFDLDGGVIHSIIQYCLSYDNEGSGYGLFQYESASPWADNTVRYCLSINDGRKTGGAGGFLVWSSTRDTIGLRNCKVYNNVVYNRQAPAVMFSKESANEAFLFANNVFIGSGPVVEGPTSGEIFAGNVWWNVTGRTIKFRGYDELKNWAKATGQETAKGKLAGSQTDPRLNGPFTTKLTNPYQLQSLISYQLKRNSPLKGKGVDLQALFNIIIPGKDFYGRPLAKGAFATPGLDSR